MELSEKILGINLNDIKDDENSIIRYKQIASNKIEDCNKRIDAELEHSSLFQKKKIKELKAELEEYFKLNNQLFELLIPFEQERYAKRVENKNNACDELINQVSKVLTTSNQNDNPIVLENEVKNAFIEAINEFKKVNGFTYVYSKDETEDWLMTEALSFNGNSIDILVTINDYGAGKHHHRIKLLSEMIKKFRTTYVVDKEKLDNSKKM